MAQSFLSIVLLSSLTRWCQATSMKIDFLPLGDVRTDPIINPNCLSDHVHTFYGANKMRPETTFQDLRNADGNTGNAEENKSLYWHPTVYKLENGIYRKADIYFASAYYIWVTGEATAFPDGFKMVAGFQGVDEARATFECVGCADPSDDGCVYSFFPEEECEELEVSMAFPTCWDGVNIDSEDHMSHVAYDTEGGNFAGECPAGFDTKIPEIQLFFRIVPYTGGTHIFADGTNFFHADYFSGWDSAFLQDVLDNCENDSDAAMPDAWCEDHLTFRDAPKIFGADSNIVSKLEPLQPETFDTTTITDEVINDTSTLPRVSCTGTLKPPAEPPEEPTTEPPTEGDSCQNSDLRFKIVKDDGKKINRDCSWVQNNPNRCRFDGVDTMCPVTCNTFCEDCIDGELRFKFEKNGRKITRDCKWVANKNTASRCAITGISDSCRQTCGLCS
mmetsp:Transcript_6233/g.7898  ORF Transcript_6233/g.7898 Transcript_6233/m.7898 type:complete len:446 (-) Transcript_6233:149-1486(-)